MPTLTLQPDPTTGEDTCIFSIGKDTNLGTVTEFSLGRLAGKFPCQYRILFRFDISALPAGAVVTSATLRLYHKSPGTDGTTAFCYRGTAPWTELGATWNRYDGVHDWPVNDNGGDWDESFSDSVVQQTGQDLIFTGLADFVADATANRNGELNLLLKTPETEDDIFVYYSSDETTQITKRPRLEIEYSLAGTRIYMGTGGIEGIDWNTPVAFVSEGAASTELPATLTPGQRYALGARRVSAADVEEHNTTVVTLVEVDAAGVLQPAPLPRPFDLAYEKIGNDTIRLGFSCDVPPGYVAPSEYRVYGDGGTGTMDYETPMVRLTEHIAGRREFVVELAAPALPLQLAAQAWKDGQAGAISPVLTIPATRQPVAPALLATP